MPTFDSLDKSNPAAPVPKSPSFKDPERTTRSTGVKDFESREHVLLCGQFQLVRPLEIACSKFGFRLHLVSVFRVGQSSHDQLEPDFLTGSIRWAIGIRGHHVTIGVGVGLSFGQ